jgi:hypothetical protein
LSWMRGYSWTDGKKGQKACTKRGLFMGRVCEILHSFMLPWSNFVSFLKGDGRTEFQIDFACHLSFLGFGVNGWNKSAC